MAINRVIRTPKRHCLITTDFRTSDSKDRYKRIHLYTTHREAIVCGSDRLSAIDYPLFNMAYILYVLCQVEVKFTRPLTNQDLIEKEALYSEDI